MQFGEVADVNLHLVGQKRLHGRKRPLVRYMQQFDACPRRKHSPAQMGERAEPGGGIGELARIGFGMGDQVRSCFRGDPCADSQRNKAAAEHADGDEIVQWIILHALNERRDRDLGH
jgi:hypothetical protein